MVEPTYAAACAEHMTQARQVAVHACNYGRDGVIGDDRDRLAVGDVIAIIVGLQIRVNRYRHGADLHRSEK
ncbi:MAG: hypothetical protein AB7V13_06185 [Pseudorhodoplanes sp.]|uniref:hypothetical protein n=1 Tax=Pseudorhodoplanes sp. TaxID=1934341 RepID=UPI003D14ACD3